MAKITKHGLQRQLVREEQHKKWLKEHLPGSAQQRQNQYRILLARTRLIELDNNR